MAVPDYESMMLPLLDYLSDGVERSLRNCIDSLSTAMKMSPDDRKILLPSGRQPQFDNRVGWARTYLKKAGLVDSPRRGFVRITERGRQVLAEKPSRIDDDFLTRFPEFVEFQARPAQSYGAKDEASPPAMPSGQTPEDLIEYAHEKLTNELSAELLKTIMQCSPSFFERLVVELLVKMGYGGSLQDAGQAIGKSGDEGIDGIIKEDKLGLDIIYIQAKRWTTTTVSRPEIQKFVGALQGQRARKGIFITTATFTDEAHQYAGKVDSKVILIDGKALARLMIEYDIGVSSVASYQLKKVDSDYFTEE